MVILYSFYKCMVLVFTEFFFGFESLFSGLTIFEPILYQLYNMSQTSFPIIHFAVFDFQYVKEKQETEEEGEVKLTVSK